MTQLRFRLACILFTVVFTGTLFAGEPNTTQGRDSRKDKGATYVVIPIKGVIGVECTGASVKAALQRAREVSPSVVLLEIDTVGGSVHHAEEIVNLLIGEKRLRLVALVRKALSAGTAIALSCRDIYVTETATLGAAVSYMVDQKGVPVDLPPDIAEKQQSAWRAVCRKAAQHGGHPALLAEGMADAEFAITLTRSDGKLIFERNGKGELVKARGRILTLTGREAVSVQLAKALVSDASEIGKPLGFPTWSLIQNTVTKEERATAERAKKEKIKALLEEGKRNERSWGKALRLGKQVVYVPVLHSLAVGEIGLLSGWMVKVRQVLGKDEAIVSIYKPWVTTLPPVSMKGVDFRRRADEEIFVYDGLMEITGTRTYVTSEGARRTVKMMKPSSITIEDIREYLMAKKRAAATPKPAKQAILLNLANNYRRSGMKDKARKLYQSIVTDYPNSAEAEQARKHLDK